MESDDATSKPILAPARFDMTSVTHTTQNLQPNILTTTMKYLPPEEYDTDTEIETFSEKEKTDDQNDVEDMEELYASTNEESQDPDNQYKTVESRKRRRESTDSESSSPKPAINCQALGLTVIFTPDDQNTNIKSFNPIKLSDCLKANCPDGIYSIRPNSRLNVIAVDTRNLDTTSTLLRIKSLCGVPVSAYEPRSKNMAMGVIHGVPVDINDSQLTEALLSKTSIVRIRRLGKSQSVALTFACPTLPDAVCVGYVRHKVYLYVEKPTQCRTCGRLGHVAASCASSSICTKCGKTHDSTSCPDGPPKCVNCGRDHPSTSRSCPRWQEERDVVRYRVLHGSDYPTAKAAVKADASEHNTDNTSGPGHGQKSAGSMPVSNKPHKQPIQEPPPASQPSQRKENKKPHDKPGRSTQLNTDDLESFPHLPNTVPTTQEDLAHNQPSTWKVVSNIATNLVKSACTPQPNAAAEPPPPALGIGSIFCAAIKALRGLLQHVSSPIAIYIVQLIDTFTPLLQQWLS